MKLSFDCRWHHKQFACVRWGHTNPLSPGLLQHSSAQHQNYWIFERTSSCPQKNGQYLVLPFGLVINCAAQSCPWCCATSAESTADKNWPNWKCLFPPGSARVPQMTPWTRSQSTKLTKLTHCSFKVCLLFAKRVSHLLLKALIEGAGFMSLSKIPCHAAPFCPIQWKRKTM